MSFFVGLYEGLLKAVIDESINQIYKLEKIDEYKTGGGHDEIVVPEVNSILYNSVIAQQTVG
jgi:hypothetical protein